MKKLLLILSFTWSSFVLSTPETIYHSESESETIVDPYQLKIFIQNSLSFLYQIEALLEESQEKDDHGSYMFTKSQIKELDELLKNLEENRKNLIHSGGNIDHMKHIDLNTWGHVQRSSKIHWYGKSIFQGMSCVKQGPIGKDYWILGSLLSLGTYPLITVLTAGAASLIQAFALAITTPSWCIDHDCHSLGMENQNPYARKSLEACLETYRNTILSLAEKYHIILTET